MSIFSNSFYVTGGTLRQDAPSYIERQADRDLYEGLLRGEYCYVLHARQMGKSSLMVHTTARLRQEGVAVAAFELTALGQNLSVEQWYDGLLARIGRNLDLEEELEEYWLAHERLAPLQRWLGALQAVVLARCPGRIVIFLDEIDAVRSLPFSTDEFFAAIRECYNRRSQEPEFARLTFCLLGVATPSDLIQDTRTTPFNIGRRIELADFTAAEAAPLGAGLHRRDAENSDEKGKRDSTRSSHLLQRVLFWTGGHPYLTQRLCQAVAEDAVSRQSRSTTDAAAVDRLCAALFLSHRARERDDNLLFVRDRLLRGALDPSRALALYLSVHSPRQKVEDDETNPLVSLLRLSGIVRERDGLLQVRNRIYARVFDRAWAAANMPDAELRRLRALAREQARRRRLAEEQRRLAEERELTARRYLYAAHMNLVQQAWDVGNMARAWELLETHRPRPRQEDLRSFEWRYFWKLCQGDDCITLRGHTGPVNQVAFSPDDRTLASASDDNTVKLWDIGSRCETTTLSQHERANHHVAFSPDGRLLASCGSDRTIRLYDAATGREITVLPPQTVEVSDIALSPDSQVLAVGDVNGTVTLWDLASRRATASLEHQARVDFVLFSPDGKTLATGCNDCTARLWDVDPTQRVLDPAWVGEREIATLGGHRGYVIALSFSPDGKILVTGDGGGDIRLWDLSTRHEITALTGQRGSTGGLAFSPDGKILAAASQSSTVKRWNTSTWEAMRPLRGHRGSVRSVAFSRNGHLLASGSEDGTVKLWEMPESGERDILRGHTGWMTCVTFSPDGKILASGSSTGDRAVRLWDCATQQQVAAFEEQSGEVWSVAFSPDGSLLAWGSDRQIVLWDRVTRQQIDLLQGDLALVRAVVFSPDGRTMASGGVGERVVKLWDVTTRSLLAMLEGHHGSIYSLAFSPDGRTLASTSDDRTARLWDVAGRREVGTLTGHEDQVEGVAFSPDGKLLATGSFGMPKLWDVGTQQELATLRGHAGMVVAVAFSADGKRLATGSSDNAIKLWDIATRQEVATLEGHTSAVNAVAFSPDGNILASAGPDTTIRLWRAPAFAETDPPTRIRSRRSFL